MSISSVFHALCQIIMTIAMVIIALERSIPSLADNKNKDKPTIISIAPDYENMKAIRTPGLKVVDHFLDYSVQIRKSLRECGYRVVEIDSLNSIDGALANNYFPEDPVVFIHSHGTIIDETPPEFMLQIRTGNVKGSNLISKITHHIKRPRIWIDSCHAGACPPPTFGCIGSSCLANQPSSPQAPFNAVIVELLCSSNTDCKTWKIADKNGDGILDPNELIQFFCAKFPEGDAAIDVDPKNSFTDEEKKQAKYDPPAYPLCVKAKLQNDKPLNAFLKRCSQSGGKHLRIKIGRRYIREWEYDGVVYRSVFGCFDSLEDAKKHLKDTFGWNSKVFSGSKLIGGEEVFQDQCTKRLPLVFPDKDCSEPIKRLQQQAPDVRNFTLEAPRCAVRAQNGQRKHFRETRKQHLIPK